MNRIKRFCYRQLRFKPSRWYSIHRLLPTIIILFLLLSLSLLFYYSVVVVYLNYCYYHSSDMIISLTSTPIQFQYELPFTIHSLLTQTKLPKEIRIYLSPTGTIRNQTLEDLKLSVQNVDCSIILGKLFDRLVQIRFEEQDYGPATKFLPIIKEFHSTKSNLSQSQAIIICDDDHYYQPDTISTLEKYSQEYKTSIVGFRGWRIREDLHWGVGSAEELSFHVIQSDRLAEIYRVGVVTANNAYLIRPSFFDSHLYLDFNQVSADIQRVDDIWLNGHAAKRRIARLVIPACCRSISISRTHELEKYLLAHRMSRASANGHALKWFNQSWEKDLWYRFKDVNRPKSRDWFARLFGEWRNFISRLKFLLYCGFI